MTCATQWLPFATLEPFATDVFAGLGVPRDEAAICADVLLTADRRGIDSHGVNRLKPIYYDRIREGVQQAVTRIEIVRESPTTVVLDGHHGMGMVVGRRAMEMAIAKAREFGMGMAAVRNSTHYGIAGYYTLMAAAAGMVGISGTNARPSVAPTFGTEGMLGTNALAFGMPSDEDFPFVLDCATSINQRGKIEYYARTGEPTPPNLVIGADGRTMTDSAQILKDLTSGQAALLPLGGIGEETGGYKGYGYSTVVEILSAALQGGSFLQMLTGRRDGQKVPYALGHFFIAVNIEAFTALDDFRKTTGDILRELRASRKMPGHDHIYTAGEKEHLAWLERRDKGVPVNASVLAELRAMRDELGLRGYQF